MSVRISVFGVGYVGTVSSACLASLGHSVIGVDVARDKLDLLRQGRSPIVEVTIDDLIAAVGPPPPSPRSSICSRTRQTPASSSSAAPTKRPLPNR
jgi:nucleoside-diphosphate-sugar epimerase